MLQSFWKRKYQFFPVSSFFEKVPNRTIIGNQEQTDSQIYRKKTIKKKIKPKEILLVVD